MVSFVLLGEGTGRTCRGLDLPEYRRSAASLHRQVSLDFGSAVALSHPSSGPKLARTVASHTLGRQLAIQRALCEQLSASRAELRGERERCQKAEATLSRCKVYYRTPLAL